MTINLNNYGLTPTLKATADQQPTMTLARVTAQHRELYQVITATGELTAMVSGHQRHQASGNVDFPTVGDWVLLTATDSDQAQIQTILPRQSVLVRGAAGGDGQGQLIAANLNTVFICMSLNANFNVRRIERYLTMVWESGAQPVVVLTKSDVTNNLAEQLAELEPVTIGVPVISCSAETGAGLSELTPYLKAGQSVAFIGSSGVGKSTLINRLMGAEVMTTKTIRSADAHGRHATTHRQLLRLPAGAVVIDTPGMRELQLVAGDLDRSFVDIATLAAKCRFRDCQHETEPGCAVRKAVEAGELSPERLASYRKLQREMQYQGMDARQLEQAKVARMFGSRREMKKFLKSARPSGLT